MLYFQAAARDGSEKTGCNTCCCHQATIRSGETNLVVIDYRNWAAPLLGKGLSKKTRFTISDCLNCEDNDLPKADNGFERTVADTAVEVTLPAIGAAKYEIMGEYGLDHGTVVHSGGNVESFIYNPDAGFVGYDWIWFRVTDIHGNADVAQVIVSVDESEQIKNPQPEYTPPVFINAARVELDRKNYLLKFPVEVSPAADVGSIYKINIRQPALDCDCNKYWHEDCIDLHVGKCG